MKVTLACPSCDQPAVTPIDHACDWQCSACDHRLHMNAAERAWARSLERIEREAVEGSDVVFCVSRAMIPALSLIHI